LKKIKKIKKIEKIKKMEKKLCAFQTVFLQSFKFVILPSMFPFIGQDQA